MKNKILKIFIALFLFVPCMLNDARAGSVKTRKLCGVTCDDSIKFKNVYCNGEIRRCSYDGVFEDYNYLDYCKYSDPLTRTSGGNNVVYRDEYGYPVYGGRRQLKNGDVIDSKNYCIGCPDGEYFYGVLCDYSLNKAWCWWREFRDQKNIEWNSKNDTCKCLDAGQQWDENKHDCVPTKGGSGSGTSNQTGTSEFCGVECNKNYHGKYLLCSEYNFPRFCNPETNKWEAKGMKFCSDKGEAPGAGFINVDMGETYNTEEHGTVENRVTWVRAKERQKYFIFDSNSKNNFCIGCRQGFVFNADKTDCVPMGGNKAVLSRPCAYDAREYDYCEPSGAGATAGRCRSVSSGNITQMSCATINCDAGYYLLLNENGGSMGICHSEQMANERCVDKCNGCNGKCVPNVVDTPTFNVNGASVSPRKQGAYQGCRCDGGEGSQQSSANVANSEKSDIVSEICGKKCDDTMQRKNVYCDGQLYYCDEDGFNDFGVFQNCEYSDPLTRTSGSADQVGTVSVYSHKVLFGNKNLNNGDILDGYKTGFCAGCESGYYYGGAESCYKDLSEAWCSWRGFDDANKKNVDWKDNACECLDSGQQWDPDKHDCVKAENVEKTETVQTAGDLGEQYKSDIQELTGVFESVVKVFVDDCQNKQGTIVSGKCQVASK